MANVPSTVTLERGVSLSGAILFCHICNKPFTNRAINPNLLLDLV